MKIYQDSLINAGRPAGAFAPTEVFNEGWLLRAVLQEWKAGSFHKTAGFLPFPGDARIYSEGQLYTPFGARFRGDRHAESHTHADGIVGHFSVSDTKSGIVLDSSFTYFAVFEAKLSSPLATRTSNAPDYDQVARTIGCMINMILQSGSSGGYAAHLVVLYPRNNLQISPSRYTKETIADQLARRIATYEGVADWSNATSRFARQWQPVLDQLHISFVTWEDALTKIANDELSHFYRLCLQFN